MPGRRRNPAAPIEAPESLQDADESFLPPMGSSGLVWRPTPASFQIQSHDTGKGPGQRPTKCKVRRCECTRADHSVLLVVWLNLGSGGGVESRRRSVAIELVVRIDCSWGVLFRYLPKFPDTASLVNFFIPFSIGTRSVAVSLRHVFLLLLNFTIDSLAHS